jgi:ketosteroid isomerase-like protein
MVACQCEKVSVMWSVSADEYAEAHLVRESVTESAGEVVYRCPTSGRIWVMDAEPDESGIPALRLRWLLSAPELIEHLFESTDPAVNLAFTHPDVEFRPLDSDTVFHGMEEARRVVAERQADPAPPKVSAVSMLDRGDDVVVFGSVAHLRDGAYTENRPAAWLVKVSGGRIARSLWFDSWEAARRAGGFGPQEDPGPKPRRLGGGVVSAMHRLAQRPPKLA